MQRTVILFVKVPGSGRVKTRLGSEIGMPAAAWWMRHQIAGLVRRLGRDRRWRLVLAVSPDGGRSPLWPAGVRRVGQGRGDLGARMARAFRAAPHGPVLIVGADIPALGPEHVAAAFRALGPADAVLGPASDGGYWLIGLKRVRAGPAGLFAAVRWSGPHAAGDTIRSLGDLRVARLITLDDIDTAADLHAYRAGRLRSQR